MTLLSGLHELPEEAYGNILVIGNFDGVHKGHQAILRLAQRESQKRNNLPIVVLMFDPHPRQYFSPNTASECLTQPITRARLLKKFGVDYVLALPFNDIMANMTPEIFIQEIIIKGLKATSVCVGHDFHFGKDRSGTPSLLKTKGKKLGLDVILLPAVLSHSDENAVPYSSTYIRELLRQGNIKKANECLGYPWEIEANVEQGDKRGRHLGFPTANLNMNPYHIPLLGVYAIHAQFLEGAFIRKNYKGIANVGIRPSFTSNHRPLLEVHLFDFDADIYGITLRISFIDFIRPEQKFEDINMLKKQISHDIKTVRQLLAGK